MERSGGLRERSKRERIDRILGAARELLRAEPDQSLTVDRIAERAEVAPMTVFNLVGNREAIWAALADRALEPLALDPLALEPLAPGAPPQGDPHRRARAIVAAVMTVICDDAAVFRALLAGWSQSGRVLERDPTEPLIDCLRAAQAEGQIAPGLDVRRLGELISAGLIGTVHQWAAGLISDRALHSRAQDQVDLAFAAARPAGAPPPDWLPVRRTGNL